MAELTILYSKDLTTAKNKLPPVGLVLMLQIITGLLAIFANFVQTVKNSIKQDFSTIVCVQGFTRDQGILFAL